MLSMIARDLIEQIHETTEHDQDDRLRALLEEHAEPDLA